MPNFNFSETLKKYNTVLTDKLLLLVVLLLGIGGLVFLLNLQKDPVLVTQQEKILPKHKDTDAKNTAVTPPNTQAQVTTLPKETRLAIKGENEVGLPLNFYISNIDPNIQYSVDFGNGSRKTLTGNSLTYAYPKAGRYLVSLKATYQGHSKIVDSQSISIADEIEVVRKIEE